MLHQKQVMFNQEKRGCKMSSIKFFCRAIDVEASLEGNRFIMPVINLWCLWMESVVVMTSLGISFGFSVVSLVFSVFI